MPIVLHIGSPKTGTSSIQAFARRHGDALRRRGLDYPPTDLVGGPSWGTHSALARVAAGVAVPGFDAARFVAEVRRRALSTTVLLSAEAMYLGRFPAVPDRGPGDLPRHEAFVARLRALFGDQPPEVRLVLRRRDSFAASFYQQIIQSDRYVAPFDAFLQTHRALFDYRGIVEIWARHFPRLVIRIFEDLTAGAGPVANFLGDLGVDIADLPVERRNVGIPIEVTEFVRHLNGTSISDEGLRRVRARLKEPGLRALFPGDGRGYFDPASLCGFLEAYAADDAWMLEHFRPTDRATLFPAGVGESEPFSGIGAATAATVASYLLDRVGPAERRPAARWLGRWRQPWKRPG